MPVFCDRRVGGQDLPRRSAPSRAHVKRTKGRNAPPSRCRFNLLAIGARFVADRHGIGTVEECWAKAQQSGPDGSPEILFGVGYAEIGCMKKWTRTRRALAVSMLWLFGLRTLITDGPRLAVPAFRWSLNTVLRPRNLVAENQSIPVAALFGLLARTAITLTGRFR